MHHGYEVEVAIEYGIEEAVLINHFAFWINSNASQGVNYIDGRFWTYSTTKGLLNSLPELRTPRVVNYAIECLVKKDILMIGHHCKNGADRTTWYAFSDKGLEMVRKYNLGTVDFAILQNRKFDNTKLVNATDNFGKCISIDTNIEDSKKEDINNNTVQKDLFGNEEEAQTEKAMDMIEEEFKRLWDLYGKKQAHKASLAKWKQLSPKDRAEALEKTPAWVEHYLSKHTTRDYQPLLSTFLNNRRWTDELTPQNGTDTSTGSSAEAQRVRTANRQQFGNPLEQLVSR